MLFCDFPGKLRKLNPRLRVDVEHRASGYHKDFPTCGLYHDRKYIMGISQAHVLPETIIAIDGNKLNGFGFKVPWATGDSGQFFDTDFIESVRRICPDALEEKILTKGTRAILSELADRNLVNRRKAELEFRIEIEEGRHSFPKRYIDLTFAE